MKEDIETLYINIIENLNIISSTLKVLYSDVNTYKKDEILKIFNTTRNLLIRFYLITIKHAKVNSTVNLNNFRINFNKLLFYVYIKLFKMVSKLNFI